VLSSPSLSRRLALIAACVLAAFLGLVGSVLDRAYRVSLENGVREKLQVQVYLLLGAAELDDQGHLVMPEVLAEPRLSSPASGLYASIAAGSGATLWQSLSSTGHRIPYPTTAIGGNPTFGIVGHGEYYALSYPVTWELANGEVRNLELHVAQSRADADVPVSGFRHTLWSWLAAVAAALILAQAGALRWGLAPLRRLANEISEIERGDRTGLGEDYPRELSTVTDNLNALLVSGSNRLKRYRDALADLAHSLKTPLAVLRSAADGEMPAQQGDLIREQVERMDQAIAYHLQRGAAAGRSAFSSALDPRETLERIGASLLKVYADKSVHLDLDIDEGALFVGDPGDFTEVVGNLLDNAFKWCRSRIRVSAHSIRDENSARGRLLMDVEDDGPGIPKEHRQRVLARGQRLDELVPGQGIGLTLVREMVEKAYGGSLTLEKSPLGGARVRIIV
jgi:two-component system, OmpR family, sensor histidine kinase PhoQ